MADTEPRKINHIVVGLGIVVIILIVLLTLALLGVFTPKPPSPQIELKGRDLYSENDLGLYDTTAKCRAKYPNNPLAFGNEKMKFNKGCYECPKGYFIKEYQTLDFQDTPRCYKTEFKPAGSDGKKLNCSKYITDNDLPDLWKYPLEPDRYTPPWENIHPYVCKVRKDAKNYVPANFLGSL